MRRRHSLWRRRPKKEEAQWRVDQRLSTPSVSPFPPRPNRRHPETHLHGVRRLCCSKNASLVQKAIGNRKISLAVQAKNEKRKVKGSFFSLFQDPDLSSIHHVFRSALSPLDPALSSFFVHSVIFISSFSLHFDDNKKEKKSSFLSHLVFLFLPALPPLALSRMAARTVSLPFSAAALRGRLDERGSG